MTHANVKLSKTELLLVCDEQFILTKNQIINKVCLLFGDLSDHFTSQVNNYTNIFPTEVLNFSPKIYKGEQYKGLPYVMLDYPRCFIKNDAFAIRCLFWWGNFFSITLHVTGKYAQMCATPVLQVLQRKPGKWYICVNEDHWQHHFEKNNYLLASSGRLKELNNEMLHNKPFFKIAKKIPLRQWDHAYEFFLIGYKEILDMLNTGGIPEGS